MDALINVNGENFQTLQILLLTTLITLLPSIVVMMTSFTRYIISLAGADMPATRAQAEGLPLRIIVPSFMTSELKHAFLIGFYLYIPFVLIDVVVASTLMSMGMIMLPPSMISMPFKLLLFISLDGWQLLFSTLVRSFQ